MEKRFGSPLGASPEAPTEPLQSHALFPKAPAGNDCHGNEHQAVCIKVVASGPRGSFFFFFFFTWFLFVVMKLVLGDEVRRAYKSSKGH